MAFTADLLFVALHSFSLVFSLTSAFADEVKVKPGEDVLLHCQAPRDASIRLLEWIRPDLKYEGDVFFYRNDRSYERFQHLTFRGRVELRDPELKEGDVSVILKNVTINDTGTYECRIIISNGERTGIELKSLLNVTVTDSGHTAGNTLDGGQTDKVIKNGGNMDVDVGLVVGLSAAALLLVFVGVMIFRKHKRLKQILYQPPPENSGERVFSFKK